MGNEQSQQEGSEGMASRVGTGASAGVPPTPPPPPNDTAPNRTGVEEENVGVAPPPGVDLSNLSEEERKMILSVMARAQDLDNDITQRRRSAELSRAESLPNSVTAHQVVCLACHVTELTNKTSAKCTKCGKTVCEKCGQHPTSADGKKYPWICNACARHHIQANRARAIGQVVKTSQDDVTRSDSAEDDPTDKKTQRKDEVPIRRQTRSPAKSRRESVEVVITDDKQQPEVRIRSAQKRSDGIVRAARPVVVINGEVSAPKNATKVAGVDTGRTEAPVESVQNKKQSQTEVKIKKPPETKPTEAVIKPLVSPKKFEAISSPKSSKKPESASTLQKTEIFGTVKKKDISGSPKRSDVVGSPKRAEVASSSPPRTEVITSPKRTEPARSPQKSKSPTSPKVTPSPKRTEMIKPQVNVSVTKVTPTAQTTSQDVPTATSRKANEILTKPAEILTKPTTIGEDKDLVSARIVASPPTTSDIVPISSSPQMTITSPVFDRPIISVDVVIVSKSSASLTTLHDASKSDTTDTMATLNTVTTTTRSKTGGSIRSSVVSITPSESVLTSPSPTKEHKAAILISDESTSLFKDSAHFSLVKKPEECSVSSRQFVSNKMTENWEQSALPQLGESNVDARDHLTKDQAKPSDSSVSTTEIRSELPSRLEISTVDASLSYQSYQDQSDANYQTKEPNQSKQKPKTIDLQSQKKVKQKVETADWSPVSDLSPIPDVSPSLEAAEQEIMEKFRGRSDSEGSNNLTTSSSAMPRATSGTISGMLADFNKALELLDTSPVEDPQKQDKPVASPTQSPPEVPATCSSLASVTTEPSIYHPVRQQRTQQQPGTPRRTRRLPQPTMEQMQAAVAMAAHGPRDKQSIALTPVSTSLPVTTSQRPVSPIMPWRTIDSYLMSDVDDYDARSLIQPATSLHEDINLAKTVEDATSADAHDRVAIAEQSIVGTERLDGSDRAEEVISSPVGQVDTELPHLSFSTENDGPTDLDIIKLKLRRKLPSVPSPEHGKLPSPNKRTKDRTRTLSTGATPLFTQEWGNGDSVEEPITTSADDSSSIRLNSQKRSASADGDYVLNLSPTRLNVSYSPEPAGHGGLGSRKELSVSQGNLPYLRTPSPLLGSDSKQLVGAGTQLPAYMKTLKQQLREELKAVTEERKRVQEVRSKERDYYMSPEKESNYVSQQWQETDASLQYDNLSHRSLLHSTPPTSTVRRQSSPHTSPRKGRRRHTSDVALRPFSPIKEDRSTEEAKSVKIAPAEEETQQKEADVSANKESTGKEMEHYFQQYSDELAKQAKEMKRITIAQMESEGSTIESTSFSRLRTKNGSNLMSTTPPSSSDSWMKSSNSCYLTTERKKQRKEKKSRKPRSWHPSPYVSEDEDEQMTREEKKAKIKAEIARRRQQIEENSRLHEELMKLAKSRENAEQMEYKSSYEYKSTPSISEHSTMYRTSHTSPSTRSTDSMLPGDTTSVLQAIDEILRKETQGVSSVRSSQYYNPAPPNVFSTMPRSRYTPRDTSWYQRESATSTMQFPDTTAEDESIARIASTFPADSASKTGRLINKPKPLLELGTPPENDITPPMPLLPDMPSRSRKLLEDLGSSPIGGQPGRGEPVQPQYRQCNENERVPHIDVEPMPEPTMMRQMRNVQRQVIVRTPQKYEFPIKRILLTRDPKDRSVSGNGLGMKVVGGKEIPGGNGLLGAYVAKVCPGGVVETMGEVREGNQVLEWNGVPLTGRTYEEVQKIISVTADEVEIVIRSDFNMLEPISSCQGLSPARDGVSPCSTPSDSLKAGTPGARTPSPCSSLTTRRVSSPASTSSSISTPTYDNIAPSHLGNIDKVQAVSREHYRRNTVQTLPRFIGNHYGPPPQPTTIERRES